MSVRGEMAIEIVIRKNRNNISTVQSYRSTFNDYVVSENEDKIIINISTESDWFRNGMVSNMLRDFGDMIYIALAYMTQYDKLVLDFDGKDISAYEATLKGKMVYKYVKKRMIIVEEDENTLTASGYVLNHKHGNPAVCVLSVYAFKPESNLTLDKILEMIK